MLPGFKPLVQALFCPFYYCWCRLSHYGEGECCPFFSRWCRRYAAHFITFGAAFYTTVRVNAAFFFGRWCRRYAARFTAVNAARFSAVGVGVTLLKNFCWYLARTRTFAQLRDGDLALFLALWDEYVTTSCSRDTAAILPALPGP